MRLSFDTIEELLAFVERLKKPRGGKNAGGDDDSAAGAVQGQPAGGTAGAPAPILPPGGGGPAFGGGAPAFTAPAGGPFGGGGPMVDPAIVGLVGRITAAIDKEVAKGQPIDVMLTWFRGELTKNGVDAANATIDQIKTTLLAKLSQPALEGIAKLTGA